ncbi:dTDP-4-dehydrorhamnose reductase [Hymenobacter sp. AT01-02]|uniref:dTDP-4-dehydrorhamnose reductase n=1 Tax=Hymenobacter sp. AT01-02 TaxID=1571877 RepID=UPI000B157C43|nr:dTDP-4-dehydrorhamnose reductase [Hymenobacter sp. AT01-02]
MIQPTPAPFTVPNHSAELAGTRPRPLLIAGAHGTLGRAFQQIAAIRGLETVALSRAKLNIADPASVERALERYQPWAVVNAAGYVRVDDAETDYAHCYRENTTGPAILAAACARLQVPLLTFSSDLVFDGQQTTPYLETDAPRPLNVYGISKQLAEREVLTDYPNALIVRTSAFFGPWDEYNFVHQVLQAARAGQPFEAASDVVISPTYVPDLVNTALDLLLDEESGIWHLANSGSCTWAEFACQIARMAGFDPSFIVARPSVDFPWLATRPLYSALGSVHGSLLPSIESGLERYLAEVATSVTTGTNEIVAAAS